VARLKKLPSAQVVRYLAVGVWNTLFGYSCFVACTWLITRLAPSHPSLAASAATVLANIISITVSFLGYKLFVFRSKGSFWVEYARSFLVYLPTMALSAFAVAPLTTALRHGLTTQAQRAPYIAGALVTVFTVVASFFGHKYISFRNSAKATS
jgi:putative flippase GtrA